MGTPHVLAIPYPAQGHVIPLMELVQTIAKQGVKVTFLNTEYNHKRVMYALSTHDNVGHLIDLVSVPDGLELWEDRNDHGKLCDSIFRSMPAKLEELIEKINETGNSRVSCIIADEVMGWALKVAEKMGIRRAAFWPASAAILASMISIPQLIDNGIINQNGTPIKNQIIRLSPTMPFMNTANLTWAIGDMTTQLIIFDLVSKCNEFLKKASRIICNSTYELEPGAFTLCPEILPIGPLLASNRLGNQTGYFWPEDPSCLKWLDQQPVCSVIYVAFGSFTVFDKNQFQELALGLELTNRPFLWVVRPDITEDTNDAYPTGFKQRVGSRGQMVGWAPQQKVLAHPSVACFLSHCGWNSTMESASNGVPFLCWPYFADQFLNQTYICDVWKVGMGFNRDDSGIIKQEEIRNKVEQLLNDKAFKARSLDLKVKAVTNINEGGCSNKNLSNFIGWIKEDSCCEDA